MIETKQTADRYRHRYRLALTDNYKQVPNDTDTVFKEWNQSEANLSTAYSQAIKYLARTNERNSAFYAQSLLEEAITRTGVCPDNNNDKNNNNDNDKEADDEPEIKATLIGILQNRQDVPLPQNNTKSSFASFASFACGYVPSRKSFDDVLHAWAKSKVRRKGFKAEALLVRMTELASNNPEFSHIMPDSKAFSLAIKCHAGSSRELS